MQVANFFVLSRRAGWWLRLPCRATSHEKLPRQLTNLTPHGLCPRPTGGRPPSQADLEQLPYLSAVVKEVLRLYPAIPVFPRQAEAADTLPSGHAINAGGWAQGGAARGRGKRCEIWARHQISRPPMQMDESS